MQHIKLFVSFTFVLFISLIFCDAISHHEKNAQLQRHHKLHRTNVQNPDLGTKLVVKPPPKSFLNQFERRLKESIGNNQVIQPTEPNSALDECSGGLVAWDNSKYVSDNIWGIQQGTASGWCCVSVKGGFGTTYSINSDGYHVGAYPSVVQGWHWGFPMGNLNTGLPVQVSSNPSAVFQWNVQHGNQGSTETWDVAFDLWLDPNPNLGATGAQHEVMIWFARSNQNPIGYPNVQWTTNLYGINFNVYSGSNGFGTCTSYVSQSNYFNMTGNLNDVLQDLVHHNVFDSSIYLLSVEAGNEIMVGTGWFWHDFHLNINGAQGN